MNDAEAREIAWREGKQDPCAPGSKQNSQATAKRGKQQTFREQLPEDTTSAGAQRGSHCDLVISDAGSSK